MPDERRKGRSRASCLGNGWGSNWRKFLERDARERERTALQNFVIVLQLMFSSSLHNDCVLRNSFDDVFEGSVAMHFRSLFFLYINR